MTEVNLDKIIKKIANSSGEKEEDVKRKIEAKRAKLTNLISPEGAAQIVAVELGVNLDKEFLKIDELLPGMKKVNVVGQIVNLQPVRSFKNNKGEDAKVVNFLMGDENSSVKVVLWDVNHIELIEKGELKEGSSIEIKNGNMRDNELHLGSFSELKKIDKKFENVVKERVIKEKNIKEFIDSDNVKTRAFIVQTFNPKFFNVCPECGKKVNTDGENFVCISHGKVSPKRKALINLILDDGTENIRSVLFHQNLEKIGLTDLEDQEKITSKREDLKGEEFIFTGNVRRNNFFNELEFVINDVEKIDLDKLNKELEK